MKIAKFMHKLKKMCDVKTGRGYKNVTTWTRGGGGGGFRVTLFMDGPLIKALFLQITNKKHFFSNLALIFISINYWNYVYYF